MTYTNISGSLFKQMVINGAINLKNDLKEIDDLNVFPVPDGDTGTNMSMTMMSGVRDIQSLDSISITEISKTLSRGLLMGARGNSGVILSQFFRGIYTGMEKIKGSSATVSEFINCLVSGYKVAYKAVMNPVEGTILTVMREAGEKVDATRKDFKDIESVLVKYVEYAEESLANTPNILPVLKDAGVVDSGGAGFLKVIKGMLMALQGTRLEITSTQAENSHNAQSTFETKDIKFGYCTEFILILNKPEEFLESELRSPLSIIGDSLVLVKDEDLCKVHVHTNNSGRALNMAQRHGEFKTIKIENMRLQHTELINKETKPVTPTPVLSKERKKYALVAVCFGEGIKNVFSELGVDYIVDGGQTMNPSTEDFVKAVESLNAENIIIIPNNSNIIMAAEQTKKIVEGANIAVLRTKTIAHGYSSLMVFDENNSLEENVEEMTAAIKNVKAGEITYAVRDTEINGVKIKSGDFMGILNGEIIISTEQRLDAAKEVLNKSVTEDTLIVTLFIGTGVEQAEVDELAEYAKSLNEEIDVQLVEGKQDIYSYIIAVE